MVNHTTWLLKCRKINFRVSFMWVGGQTQRCLLSSPKVGWPVHTESKSP